jgi:hypothetical protein
MKLSQIINLTQEIKKLRVMPIFKILFKKLIKMDFKEKKDL